MKKHGRTSGQSVNPKPWRLKAGIGIFVLSIVLPVVGTPLVAYSQRRFAFGVFLFVLGGDFWEKLRNLFIHRPVSSGGRSDADDTLV